MGLWWAKENRRMEVKSKRNHQPKESLCHTSHCAIAKGSFWSPQVLSALLSPWHLSYTDHAMKWLSYPPIWTLSLRFKFYLSRMTWKICPNPLLICKMYYCYWSERRNVKTLIDVRLESWRSCFYPTIGQIWVTLAWPNSPFHKETETQQHHICQVKYLE